VASQRFALMSSEHIADDGKALEIELLLEGPG
jgi:hypothetical protein